MTVTPLHTYTLSASMAGAIAGVDKYRSPVAVYGELTGVPAFQRDETEAMKWGTLLESAILDALAPYGVEFALTGETFRDPARPWLVGHPDALNVEAKTHSRWVLDGGAIPLADQAQMQTYMHLTETEDWTWACLVDGQRLDVRTVERDDTAIARLLASFDEFYELLRTGTWPDPAHATKDDLANLHPSANGTKIRETGAIRDVRLRLAALTEQEKHVKAQRAECESIIKAYLGEAETLVSLNGDDVARWSNVTRKAYTREVPESTSRRFTLL